MTEETTDRSFRHSAAFGKRIEYYIIGLMLKENLDVYLPMVDDDAIDAVIKKPDGTFIEVQIKARSTKNKFGNGALFAGIQHDFRKNYWFVFYSERLSLQENKDIFWILSSKEFIKEAFQIKTGKNAEKRTLKLSGVKTKLNIEYVLPQFEKYVFSDFKRILNENPD